MAASAAAWCSRSNVTIYHIATKCPRMWAGTEGVQKTLLHCINRHLPLSMRARLYLDARLFVNPSTCLYVCLCACVWMPMSACMYGCVQRRNTMGHSACNGYTYANNSPTRHWYKQPVGTII